MRFGVALFSLIVILGCRRTEMSKASTLEQLGQAALWMRVVSDGNLSAPQNCGWDSAKAFTLAQPLKEQIDLKIQELTANYPQNIPSDEILRSCAEKCLCGIYEDLLSAVEEARLSPSHKALKESMSKSAASLTPAQAVACVQKIDGICKSPLLKLAPN